MAKENPQNTIPIIDRMNQTFDELGRSEQGATSKELARSVDVPLSTMYRLLNSLAASDLVRKQSNGRFVLGTRLIGLAGHVERDLTGRQLATLARPILDHLSRTTGEGCRVSVRDGLQTLVVAVGRSTDQFALTATPGERLPLHAGSSAKLLLAHAPETVIEQVLEKPLPDLTGKTLTSSDALRTKLDEIRRDDLSRDEGEFASNVHSLAVPIRDRDSKVICAVSAAFIAGKYADPDAHLLVPLREAAGWLEAALAEDEGHSTTSGSG